MENHKRAILASGIFRSQDLPSYLSILYSVVERYGSPEAIVTDGHHLGLCQAQKLEGLQEGLAKREAALWLAAESLTLEYAVETLSRYDVQYVPDPSKLKEITKPRLLETSYMLAQFSFLDLEDAPGEGWLEALKLKE